MYKLISITILLVFASCKGVVEKQVMSNVERSYKSSIDSVCFDNIPIDYDSILILTPYSNLDLIGKDLGIDLSELEGTGIESMDDRAVFAVIKNRTVVDYDCIYRNEANFAVINRWKKNEKIAIYPKEKVFYLEIEVQGNYIFKTIVDR